MKIKYSSKAKKQLRQTPKHIQRKLEYWIDLIGFVGLREARKYRGFHDEPLVGSRFGQRSVRLSKAYRFIYTESKNSELLILEVHKHDY